MLFVTCRAPDSPTKNTPLIDEDHVSSDAPQPVFAWWGARRLLHCWQQESFTCCCDAGCATGIHRPTTSPVKALIWNL